MGIMTLLARAQLARLSVEAIDNKLLITGPRRAATIAQELGQYKAALLLAPAGLGMANGTPARRTLPTATQPQEPHVSCIQKVFHEGALNA